MGEGLVLETRGLSKQFGGVQALRQVDFRLRAGELRCLIGPNGAGKSTFFKLLSGQLRPSAGTILFEGTDISRLPAYRIGRLGIGIKNQVPSVYEGLSVRENVWLAARTRAGARAAAAAADALIEELALAEIAGRTVNVLAHGQRQWVEIAMIMARRPRLVLLDEPAAGMAAEETARTADLIRRINRSASVIVVEHDMQFIRQLDAVVTVFHQGAILAEDRMEVIQHDPRVRAVYLGSAARQRSRPSEGPG
ncbi:MAG: ATP-binding cassette domain-containing protein [Rhodospirillaceae bacterium]|nr:ATP-binding cassette domain-containing protein [Rhodospirillaceae bacterium]